MMMMTPKISGLVWHIPHLRWSDTYRRQLLWQPFDAGLNLTAPSLCCSWQGDSKRESLFNLLRNFSMYVGV